MATEKSVKGTEIAVTHDPSGSDGDYVGEAVLLLVDHVLRPIVWGHFPS
jgi:hypothetical protein